MVSTTEEGGDETTADGPETAVNAEDNPDSVWDMVEQSRQVGHFNRRKIYTYITWVYKVPSGGKYQVVMWG